LSFGFNLASLARAIEYNMLLDTFFIGIHRLVLPCHVTMKRGAG
jgi:hypothetical protein